MTTHDYIVPGPPAEGCADNRNGFCGRPEFDVEHMTTHAVLHWIAELRQEVEDLRRACGQVPEGS